MVRTETDWELEYRFKSPEGSIKWVYGIATQLKDSNNKIVGYIGANIDITDQRNATEKLKESEKRYRHLVENASDAIYLSDSKGQFLDVNLPLVGGERKTIQSCRRS